ncbi:MAG: MAPEG family protein [Solimonas sp.]
MTIALWCVLIAGLLPFPFTLTAKWSKRFDNAAPRDYFDETEGWRKRAHWVQLNSFEAFPFFAAGAIVAHLVVGPNMTADGLAASFIVLRVLYGICYLTNLPTLRSLVWFGAMLCSIGLFVVAIRTGRPV